MPRRALVEHRPWLLASLVAAVGFYFLSDDAIGGLFLILIKGAAVAALAGYALQRHPGVDARILGLVMAFSSLGDMAIELSLEWGGAAFLAAHTAAIVLYLRNRRNNAAGSQKAAAAALFIMPALVAYLLTSDWLITLYSLALGAMAGAAWMSRFSRYRVGLGAVLFVVSDLMIFGREGMVGRESVLDWLIWPIYYAGQFLICTGVVQTLRRELPSN